jgi:hypothetical protein
MVREILNNSKLNQVRKRIEALAAATLGKLYRGSNKPLFIPVLDLPQANTDDAAYGLAVKGFHLPGMKTTMFLPKIKGAGGNVKEIER